MEHTPGPNEPTPGPWVADPTKSFYVFAADGHVLFSCDRQANARLAAAAPDLLAALLALTATARTFRNVPKSEQEWTPIDDEALDAAFAAIQKATGQVSSAYAVHNFTRFNR